MDRSSIFVVVAAYNEAAVLASTLKPLIEQGYTVVVVDDGSTDFTWALLQTLPVHGLRHRLNLGQGAALQTGMDYALRRGAEIVVHFDADGQHPADQIDDLTAPIEVGEADVVFGSRFLRESDSRLVPAPRRAVLRTGMLISRLMGGLWLRDTHNGFRALSRRAMMNIRLRENGFAHATEIQREVRRARLRYQEAPATIRYSEYSAAKGQPLSNSFNIVVDLVLRKLFG